MPTAVFEKHIQELNFSFISDRGTSGVLLTANYEKLNEAIASPDILFALETACKFEADAVYFRYFQDGRAAVPQLYIFDYTQKSLSTEDRNRIHRNIWNGYQVPAYIIIEKSIVSVFDAREKPKEDKEHYAEEIIRKTGDAIKSFNAHSFDDGLFWEEENNKKRFQFEQSATRDLIRGLKNVYEGFQKESKLNKHVALKLLVQSLLIKYLEERDEDSKSGYFAGTYFKNNFQCTDFCDVIRKGKLLLLLDKLAEDFNGKIFEWDKEDEADAREAIQKGEVQRLADYLDGNNDNGQLVIWRLYSFSHLPVEVISSVYEELLTDSKDIVYTPEMIVSTLVDECMPLKVPQKDFKLIDVSCGSGIFLVKAYKRIVQWWRYEQWQKTGKLEKPSLAVLKDLLLKSIHGIDIQQDAIRLSVFSLALAILDEVNLDPPTWGKLKFPDMSDNIITKDFFEFITDNPPNDFSLVIGNPPFNPPQIGDEKKQTNNGEYIKSVKEKYEYKSEIKIPDENLALHFLVQSMKILKEGGLLSMIQPSGPLLYQKDIKFKKDIFSSYNLLQVIDFTKLADKLWGRKNVATAAIFLQNTKPDSEFVLHLIANRTFSNTNRLFLEFDYYDFHFLNKSDLIYNPFIWKANLSGGGRLVELINRLSALPTLGDFLKNKRQVNKWVFGDGFIKGKPDDELVASDFEKKKGGYSTAEYLTGSKCFNPEDFDEEGIKRTFILTDKYFQWPRQESLFQAPTLLIKKNIGKESIPVVLVHEPLSYRNEVIGIHAPIEDIDELKELEATLKNNQVFRAYLMLTSSRSGISRSNYTLLQKDIMNLPYLKGDKLSETENIVIDDLLSLITNNEFGLHINVSKTELDNFSDIFCTTLNSIYRISNNHFQLYKILHTENYYAIHFEYSEETITPLEEQISDLEQYIKEAIPQRDTNQQHVHIQKIMKVYGRDSIILVKPKQLRYWLPSIALRDADEVFADYVKARYQDA
ncbi:class I SAM-dependent DNA methyltransferase [Sphingobacterium sp. BN32]|uniref:HsdM family class I SAM-dependent methyltransferase n=1 Tax=Sphingobacterium sp. BN32 TaxID=3058432 RepID=UPI00265CBDCF|nr:N-6 DNA methylase [Sphingobacterium sp. BN32]WKK59678.1 N-6 DNA methylase [Sphingobacterium sp. BN32]